MEVFLNQDVAWILIIGFTILWLVLGWLWGRDSGSTKEFIFAGRNIGLAFGSATLMASWVTGNTTLAAPEMAYTLGFWGIFGYALAGLGLIAFAPLSKRIRTLMPEGFTSGQFIRIRYGKIAWIIFLIISACYFLGFLITQGMGAGLLLSALTGMDYRIGMIAIIFTCTLYTLIGGMKAVVGSDFIQSLLILISLIVVAVLAYVTYGVDSVYTGLKMSYSDRLNLLLPAGLIYAWNTGLFSIGEIFHSNIWWSRAFSIKPKVLTKSFILSGVTFMFVPIVTGSIALVALAQNFNIPQVNMVFPIVASKLLGITGAVLVFLVVYSSLASSIDSVLKATSDLLTEDIYRQLINPKATDKQLLAASKFFIIALGILTIILSWNYVTTMYGLLLLTGALVASSVWPIATGIYWKTANRKGAIYGMLFGSISGLLTYFFISNLGAALVGMLVSAIIVVSYAKIKPENFDWEILKQKNS